MSEDFSTRITLVDDDGNEQDYMHIDTVELEGNTYVALIPVEEDPAQTLLGDTYDKLVILKIVSDGAEEYLQSIEDEEEFDKVLQVFEDSLSDEYDIENEDE